MAATASFVAAFFTFGVGTVVGFSATAIVGGTSVFLGQSYKELEETFKSFRGKMDKLNHAATDMGPSIGEIERLLLTRAGDKIGDVDRTVNYEGAGAVSIDFYYFSTALDTFIKWCGMCVHALQKGGLNTNSTLRTLWHNSGFMISF